MEEIGYKSVKELLDVVAPLKGHDLQVHVEPQRRVIGFLDHTTGKFHRIGVSDLRASVRELPLGEQLLLRKPDEGLVLWLASAQG